MPAARPLIIPAWAVPGASLDIRSEEAAELLEENGTILGGYAAGAIGPALG